MRSDYLLLADMLEAIDEILASAPGSREEFDNDKFRRSHLLRYIQIVGEAAWRLSAETKAANPDVPWREIAGMRHAIVHDYFEVDWNEVYNVTVRDIPMPREPVERICNSARFREPDEK